MYAEGEFDIATLFFSKFKSVISQIPTAQPDRTCDDRLRAILPIPAAPSMEFEPDETIHPR